MARLVACVLLLAVSSTYGRHEQYEGHQLFQIRGPQRELATLGAKGALDLLSTKASTSGVLEAMVKLSPEERQQWLPYFDQREITYTKIADNLAEILRKEEQEIELSRLAAARSGEGMSWDTYYDYEAINNHLDELARQNPGLVTVINAGLTFEGRQIKYVRISTTRFENELKPVIVIDAAVHAREWITPPVALYIIDQLISHPDDELTTEIDWIIIPLANPDGYEYSMNSDRLWRKTRSRVHTGSDECPGVDGNRNFDHYWGTSDSANDPCTIVYEGPAPFSEPETRVIRDAVMRQVNRTPLYISLHSYGNMFLYAWGNNGTLPENGLILHLAGVRMAQAIDAVALDKSEPYIVGNAANVLYYTTGTSRDWTKSVGVTMTYTLELPGYEYGFIVPPQYIKQVVTETWAGIAEGARYILSW
ncbi:carboxypeptidase B-like [Plutella xylostella]|uniref:carboxypeptidase B-like n=1 Tax=Plutella xylostella TaxID=51655 RepID=UPI0020322664|nr:carboxypeptidase B-like [Plutella xylostella]